MITPRKNCPATGPRRLKNTTTEKSCGNWEEGRGDEGGAEPEQARRLRARDISTATKNGKEKRAGVENNSNLNAEKS